MASPQGHVDHEYKADKQCVVDYGRALAEPFAADTVAPCNPLGTTVPTLRVSSLTRGFMEVGTEGTGFILASKHNPGNDKPSFSATTQAYNGAGINITLGGLNLYNAAQLPFTTAQIQATDNPMSYRFVGVAIRAFYVGKYLDLNGLVHCYQPADVSVPSTTVASLEDIRQDRWCWVGAAKNGSQFLSRYVPRDIESNSMHPATSLKDVTTSWDLALAVQGTHRDKWYFEARCFYEIQTKSAMSSMTLPSHSAPALGARMLNIVQDEALNYVERPITANSSGWQHILQRFSATAGDALVRVGMNYALQRISGRHQTHPLQHVTANQLPRLQQASGNAKRRRK